MPLLAIASLGLAGCGGVDAPGVVASAPQQPVSTPIAGSMTVPVTPVAVAALDSHYSALYQPVKDKFEVPGVSPSLVRKGFERKEVAYATKEPVGTIVVDPKAHYLYLVELDGRAMRYGVAVGKQGFAWKGEALIKTKQEWQE